MEELRQKYEKLTKQKAPLNMSKAMLEKYITWNKQVNFHELKELQQLLKGNSIVNTVKSGTKLVREYQGQKYEVSIIDGDFFYAGTKYKSLSKIAREITGQIGMVIYFLEYQGNSLFYAHPVQHKEYASS